MTVTLPDFPDSFTPLSTPIADPSFAPKTPLRFGFACRIALVRSVDLSWSAAVLRRDDLDIRVFVLDLVGEALHAVDAGAAGLVVRDDRDFAGPADEGRHLVRRCPRR